MHVVDVPPTREPDRVVPPEATVDGLLHAGANDPGVVLVPGDAVAFHGFVVHAGAEDVEPPLVAWSPCGRTVATGNSTQGVLLVDASTGHVQRHVPLQRKYMTIALISVLFLSILQCPFGEARVVVCRSRFRDFSVNFRVFSSKFHKNQQISTKNLQKMMKLREI